jgi:hypothetical protein
MHCAYPAGVHIPMRCVSNSNTTTTETMAPPNRPRYPADVFNINDHVKCISTRSKHYGHTATVIGMGRAQLHVEFDNGHVGKFIDFPDAKLTKRIEDSPPVTHNVSGSSERPNDNDTIGQLTTLLEHMAFTTATLISSNHSDSQGMATLLDSSDHAVRDHTHTITNTRHRSAHLNDSNRPGNRRPDGI